jgi:hypothetical protein
MASLTAFGHPAPQWRYPHASTMEALRGDWVRIGRDMKLTAEREHARLEEKKKQ